MQLRGDLPVPQRGQPPGRTFQFLGVLRCPVLVYPPRSRRWHRPVRPARIHIEHAAARKRIDVVGYLRVEAEGDASEPGDVRCGIPGFDHPGTELHGDTLRSTDPALRWQVTGRRHAAFTTDFDYRSGP